MLYFVTGGERSGKTRFATALAQFLSDGRDKPLYIATARPWDDDFRERIAKHIQARGSDWENVEQEKQISRVIPARRVVVIDCVTLWLTNYFSDNNGDMSRSLAEASTELESLFKQNATLIIISNEIGMGGHADTELGRKFTELHGWVNQQIAARADTVVFLVSGIPVTIKGKLPEELSVG